ncbi:DnaD domain protein [Ruminococcus sp.]|uniref:DnaD domain protein n=1 Tax=Ruminococcus sp. TaxID=41978 RepID=UPI0025E06B10|nr:DnaD domain protein [Ruminococcus sp.]
MEFKVNCGIWGTMFGVPGIVADNFLKLATGGQIKVLLFLLRYSGKMCSLDEISSNTGVQPDQVEEAILFWQQANVLTPQNIPEITTARTIMQQPLTTENKAISQPNNQEQIPDNKTNYSGSEIAEIMKDSRDIRELFKIVEGILGTLKNGQMNSIIWMYDHLGLKKEVIITLITYCSSIEKTNTAYIEKIAADWAENDINSMSAAQDEIQRLTSSRDYAASIMKLFEMTRRPTSKQFLFIQQWKNAGYELEIIHYAYEKTLEQINKLSFDYINKILISWNESGFKTVQDVKNAESNFRKNKKDKNSQNNEIDPEIEKYKSVINKFLY